MGAIAFFPQVFGMLAIEIEAQAQAESARVGHSASLSLGGATSHKSRPMPMAGAAKTCLRHWAVACPQGSPSHMPLQLLPLLQLLQLCKEAAFSSGSLAETAWKQIPMPAPASHLQV
eukprot:CAMPEP_0170582696 /NCGR_PEP_ID=MMETSP0224-20130122/7725_1 /TAXON_ID=285029 /ORGANISM="Togula jolla, Strain CCCM 725" /LENGTH=116 /DNA_ID=CAMNT_0010905945 /DNA_START=50 /DNA_END=402 /DNA_ORIENTATION=-